MMIDQLIFQGKVKRKKGLTEAQVLKDWIKDLKETNEYGNLTPRHWELAHTNIVARDTTHYVLRSILAKEI